MRDENLLGDRDMRRPEREKGPVSLFRHELEAIQAIERRVSSQKLGYILHNLNIHDKQTNRYFEVDVVIICTFGIYVVELKHWSGIIEVRPYSWVQNKSFFKEDPHKTNNFKAKLLKGLYERRFPTYPSVYFESVVILTNPDVIVEGASIPATTTHNPTFDSIERFVRYLINQRKNRDLLSDDQCRAFVEWLKKLHTPAPPRDFIFPGYEIVERLYQHTDRAEVIARRKDVRNRPLSRLRIFFPPTGRNEEEQRLFHERATATLNAVAKIGDHPNILKVWPVPNENNYIVEGSDWSETGTLRDLLTQEQKLSPERATSILIGVLQGLKALHRECLIHRTLSPENILMIGDTPKLMNFDLSYQLEDNRVTVIPDVSKLKRSPYIAPEIYKGGIIPEATADLFSVGVIFYEMLTGERPFKCSTDLAHMNGQLETIHREKLVDNNVSQHLQDVVFELVRSDPSSRLADASDVIALLRCETEAMPTAKEVNARLNPGDRSGLYEIEEFLKRGAVSQIYRARGARARPVALKVFDVDVPLQRVVQEQQFAAAVHHSSIVRVDSYNRWSDGRFYIAFDWVSDRSLRDEIDNGTQPDINRFKRVAIQLLDAVSALHAWTEEEQPQPIVHNDIKPENILLADGDRPVLIDFGSASHPHVGAYEGTEGYVAPDLQLGQDRKYCEDGDLYALGVTLFEWFFGQKPQELTLSPVGIQSNLLEWLKRATAQESSERFSSAKEMRDALERALETPSADVIHEIVEKHEEISVEEERPSTIESLEAAASLEDYRHRNPFVAYLNSLHCRDAGNENALAESQARSKFFGLIHVPHPVANTIERMLFSEDKRHIILTGHAGDGKSTIAMELYKRFKKLPTEEPLSSALKRREDLSVDGTAITFIKDFSEWSENERMTLLEEMLSENSPRFFLVTNTGTLLNTFRDYERKAGGNWAHLESEILKKIDSATPSELPFRDTLFSLINLSMIDNLGVAEQILQRMIAPERWRGCSALDCHEKCPIIRNVRLILDNEDVVRERVFLAYRRMYEYGTRFTLRQLSAHLAYMITSGLGCQDVLKMSQQAASRMMAEFMFFNRYFGDNGKEIDDPALQLSAIRAIREQGFGMHPCPTWERRLWMQSEGLAFRLNAKGCDAEFEQLRRYGARLTFDPRLTDSQAREQVRRMLFFLHRFDPDDGGVFLKTFLNSLMILDFARWQKQPTTGLTLQEERELRRRIMHVLQEHFTGVRLPEGASFDRYLFITLCRRSYEVRQSAQVVLACFPEDDFRVALTSVENGIGGTRRELVLEGRGRVDVQLRLGLPFLDYVMMRNQGEVGEDLQVSYVDRLEKFKGQLIRLSGEKSRDDIVLVRLRTNHTFRRQVFAVRENRLEVTDG